MHKMKNHTLENTIEGSTNCTTLRIDFQILEKSLGLTGMSKALSHTSNSVKSFQLLSKEALYLQVFIIQ
jgi:hypothetical protein